jgi:outer membrane protein assembly factor BamB
MKSLLALTLLASGLLMLGGCSRADDQPLVTSESVTLADAAAAPHWPAFAGPRGDNISDDKGLLPTWPDDGPPLVWKATGVGQGYSSVSLARGLILTAGSINDQSVVTALDLDGKIRWQTPVGGAWTGAHPGTRSTPTIDDDRIYFQSPLGDLACLAAATGKPIWQVNTLERFGAKNIMWALAESIVVDGPRVLSTPGGPQTAVVALDKMTGETIWQSPTAEGDAAGYATPTLAEYAGKRLIFAFTAKAIICVDADSGSLYWRFPHETSYDVNAMLMPPADSRSNRAPSTTLVPISRPPNRPRVRGRGRLTGPRRTGRGLGRRARR